MPVSQATVAGALLGCAIGDALGAPFEGLWAEAIPAADDLLQGFHEYHGFPRGQYTDDTQLTVAAIESIVERGAIEPPDIAGRFADLWRHHAVIGPGGACTRAAEHFLATGDWATMGAPEGQAGNGAAMRTAVLGLWFVDDPLTLPAEIAAVSRLTHTDGRSVAGGVAIAEAARYLAAQPSPFSAEDLCISVANACDLLNPELAALVRQLPARASDETALEFIAWAGQSSPEFSRPIITPFVIPTVLASLFCLLRHPGSWSRAVAAAVRLGGDVDTLGAIVGALAGAHHGIEAIPKHLVDTVYNSRRLRILAARFHAALIEKTARR